MKKIFIALVVVGVLVFGVLIYLQKKKGIKHQIDAVNDIDKSIALKEKESSIQYRAGIYDDLSSNEKYALWKEIFEDCPSMKKVITDQMRRWKRPWDDQLDKEIDWYMTVKGRNPKDFISSCK